MYKHAWTSNTTEARMATSIRLRHFIPRTPVRKVRTVIVPAKGARVGKPGAPVMPKPIKVRKAPKPVAAPVAVSQAPRLPAGFYKPACAAA
jgi:hypothetical protein